jgi:hypothetical protein
LIDDAPGEAELVEFVDGANGDPVEVEGDVVDGGEEFGCEGCGAALGLYRADQGHRIHHEVAQLVGEGHSHAVGRQGCVYVHQVRMVLVCPQGDGVDLRVAEVLGDHENPCGFQ